MFVADDRVIYSASDLAAAARCEYALLRSFDARLGRGEAIAADDELLRRTAELGDAHEQHTLAARAQQLLQAQRDLSMPSCDHNVHGARVRSRTRTDPGRPVEQPRVVACRYAGC